MITGKEKRSFIGGKMYVLLVNMGIYIPNVPRHLNLDISSSKNRYENEEWGS